ncbi:amino acid adenylation domain-containing protein [Streptomyces cinnamoneus]|uniref:amino acid adenylation domain-containing protein n=1 Tax=Streptomyces cinnamoneus TaxID=53446 RepID=UPI00378A35B4
MAGEQQAAPGRTARTVLEGFDIWVTKAPDDPAVISGGTALSYRELDEAAEALARDLRALGAGPETVVGLCVQRGTGLAVAVLGVVKAGAAYLPLDPAHPAERSRSVLADAGARLVVTDRSVSAGLDAEGWGRALVYEVDGERPVPAATDPGGPAVAGAAGEADRLLYVIYTSGSTGRPKGIAMQSGPQITLLDWCREHYAERPVALQYFPVTADVAFLELMSTWWLGGCAVIATELERYDVAALAGLIERHAVTKVLLPVVALDELARYGATAPHQVATLRELITTGDRQVVTPAIRELCDRSPGTFLDNHYGSTEVNVVTAPRLTAPAAEWPDHPLTGRPMSGARIYVLDANLSPVPPNVQGEIYVGGGPPARGYAGRPGLTAAAFLPDPYAGVPGARMYRTGDLGRWRPGGVLEYLGRADFQIKLHGYRIEPGEIESLLRERADVERAVVLRIGEGQDAYLAAYLVAVGEPPAPGELREYLALRLPTPMVPSSYVFLPEFPLTDTGKVDRKALPLPDGGGPQWIAPRDETERTAAEVLAQALGRERIGVTDDFFRLGGHSLLVTQVVHRLRAAFGVQLPLRAVFERPTAAALAEEIRRLREERG